MAKRKLDTDKYVPVSILQSSLFGRDEVSEKMYKFIKEHEIIGNLTWKKFKSINKKLADAIRKFISENRKRLDNKYAEFGGKEHKMKYFFLIMISLALLTCSKTSDDKLGENCETVINAQGPGYLKVINRLNTKIAVYLPEYAFQANVDAIKCELYGMALGTRKAEISICVNSDCDDLSNSKTISFVIKQGEIYTVDIDNDFF